MSFDVRKLDGGFGREIVGLDVAGGITAETASALRQVWLEHGVLVFRGIGTEPGWSVEVGGGATPRLSADLDYGERRIEVARANRTSDGYVGSTGDGLAVSLTMKKESCSDGMSDIEYPASAILTIAGKTYRGCGRFLTE